MLVSWYFRFSCMVSLQSLNTVISWLYWCKSWIIDGTRRTDTATLQKQLLPIRKTADILRVTIFMWNHHISVTLVLDSTSLLFSLSIQTLCQDMATSILKLSKTLVLVVPYSGILFPCIHWWYISVITAYFIQATSMLLRHHWFSLLFLYWKLIDIVAYHIKSYFVLIQITCLCDSKRILQETISYLVT